MRRAVGGYSRAVVNALDMDIGFRSILDALHDGVYVVGPDHTIVYWSAGAERITGYSPDEVVGRRCDDAILAHTDLTGRSLCAGGCPIRHCMDAGRPHDVREVFLKRKDGRRLAVYVKTTVLEIEGRRHGVEVFGELETVAGKELVARIQELSDSAVTDPLTGLFNRRYLDAVLAQQFAMYRRLGRRYGIIQMDVDVLKEINDRLGHATGDEAIRFIAGVLADNVREMDVAARFGGDEFVVVCGVAGREHLEAYGRRLMRLVHDSCFVPAERAGLRLTVSAGGTLVTDDDVDEREALRRADRAMYAAKRSGRREFVVLDGDEPQR